ncbi:CYFA0S01e09912g1_1 [Cyberlindnera fabianii]|uniref:CYFA0S01e09912g1_1 n=1 Tax=Cyberlindnera fabianii TaxID=36022 RepID=A0A061APR0_CYBFA|nr:hypothetical protein BON22_0405 [Cyberlindnera fabianii]CDR37353.1 CYFA0S01e09912g1_1 [Cyberlindnera fabianii]
MSQLSPTFKKNLNNFAFVCSIAIGSIYVVKSFINKKRDTTFTPDHFSQEQRANDNIAKIQPGLPEPTGKYKRKSDFEAAPGAYQSRRGGDRFSGILDLNWLKGGDDKK